MSKRLSYRVERHTTASPEAVFDVVADAPGWRTWAPLVSRSGWEDPARTRVGAVRLVGSAGVVAREQIEAWERPGLLGYTILGGGPARDYHAEVRCTRSTDGGTVVVWSGDYRPHGLFGRPYLLFLRWLMPRLTGAMVAEAERRTTA